MDVVRRRGRRREAGRRSRENAPCWRTNNAPTGTHMQLVRGCPASCTLDSPKRPRQRAQRTRSIMSGRLSTPTDFETELQRIPSIKCALVTDLQGVVLLRAGSSTDEAALQQMAATFALTTDQANKLRLGKTKHFTLCYGAFAESEDSCTHTHTASHLTPVASPAPQRP
eukprot:scaffold60052_cov59-Phaeocystis_antarctica.AAC.14